MAGSVIVGLVVVVVVVVVLVGELVTLARAHGTKKLQGALWMRSTSSK